MVSHPDFICVAAQKTGTGWLYDQTRSHPRIWMPPLKEIGYLIGNFESVRQNAQKTLSKFDQAQRLAELSARDREFLQRISQAGDPPDLDQYVKFFEVAGDLVTGDISPSYQRLDEENVVALVKALPNCRIVDFVRDPIERLWSQVNMRVRNKRAAPAVLTQSREFERLVRSPIIVNHSFQSEAIRRWRKIAGSERFRAFVLDDLLADAAAYRRAVFAHIGLNGDECPHDANYKRKADETKAIIPDGHRKFLLDYFAAEYQALKQLIDSSAVKSWPLEPAVLAETPPAPIKLVEPVSAKPQLVTPPAVSVPTRFPLDYPPSNHEREIVRYFKTVKSEAQHSQQFKPYPSVFVCFANRSGSNYLADLLASTGKMPRAREIFNVPVVLKLSKQNKAESFRHFCQMLARSYALDGLFASKVAWQQLYFLARTRMIPEVFAAPRFIHVRRRDLLGQAISFVIAHQTGAWTSEQVPEREPLYDSVAIADQMGRIADAAARFEHFFATFGFPHLDVAYEDFVKDKASCVSDITTWLGLGPSTIKEEKTHFQRQRNTINDQWRERFLAEHGAYFASDRSVAVPSARKQA
jgi:LPS sulfotransferase NodH